MDDEDFDHLKTRALSRKRIKTNLIEHRETIKKMMDADISLPLIFEWLTERKVETALTTLRRFVKKTFGETFYVDFSSRNGWQKSKQIAPPVRAARTGKQTATTSPRTSGNQEDEINSLGNPADINHFFNRRKS